MKITGRLLTLLLCMLLFLTACTQPQNCDDGHTDEDEDFICDVCHEPLTDDFLPILRFAITSDVHVRSTKNDFGSKQKLLRFILSAYEYAETQKPYASLDGLFIVGDLTQDGKSAEYEIATDYFKRMVDEETTIGVTMGNHEFHAYGSGNDRFTAANIAKSTTRFKTALGYECEDWHKIINGYHFISIANDSYESNNFYNEDTLEWLRAEIEKAIDDDKSSDKPIFVMNHEGPQSSVRGFKGGDPKLTALLKSYPRVVDFSGHTHRSILDPQSIWQDGFTAIGTGGLAYLGYNMAGHPTLDDSAVTAIDDEGGYIGGGNTGARTGAMYYVVEVDRDNNIRLQIYDILTESFYGEPIIFKVGADEPQVFTEERAERSVAPIFPKGATIEALSTDYNLPIIKFSTPTDGDLAQYYRIELTKEGENEPSLVFYRLGAMQNAAKNLTHATSPIRGHSESGVYKVKIYAVNCWGKESLPIEGRITVAEKTMTPDIMSISFNANNSATSGSSSLITLGTPSVTFDEQLQRNIVTLDGASGYSFEGIRDYYSKIIHSLTIEAYFRAGECDSTVAIGANYQSAGFGLYRTADGRIRFNIRFNNGASRDLGVYTAPGVASIEEWAHAVIVYNNSTGISIYVNGEQLTLYDADGKELGSTVDCAGRLFEAPSGAARALVVGGDVSSSGEVEFGFVGDIAAYNLYSRPLTASEVSELYSAYN